MGKTYSLDDPEQLDVLKRYFDLSEFLEDESSPKFEINEKYEGFGDIHIYDDKKSGRILIMRQTGTEYDELLLFSPLGTLEEESVNSSFTATEMEYIVERILNKNWEFRTELITDFCRSREKFNINLKNLFDINFDFFLKCEVIAELNPLCIKREDFKSFTERISNAIDSYNCEKVRVFLGTEKIDGSIAALAEILKKVHKENKLIEQIEDLRIIQRLRNMTPTHSTNEPLGRFLKRFNMKYPDIQENWCDLSIFVLRETSRIIDRISKVLGE